MSCSPNVTCKHANVGTVQVFHIDRVKPFYGSLEEATVLAQVDYQQFVVLNITAYRGDPEKRSEMEFLLEYEDGTIPWKYSHGTKTCSIAYHTRGKSVQYHNSDLFTFGY